MPLGHTLTNLFVENFYQKLKKLSKLFLIFVKTFSKNDIILWAEYMLVKSYHYCWMI